MFSINAEDSDHPHVTGLVLWIGDSWVQGLARMVGLRLGYSVCGLDYFSRVSVVY